MSKSAEKESLISVTNGDIMINFSKDNFSYYFASEDLGVSVYVSGNIY